MSIEGKEKERKKKKKEKEEDTIISRYIYLKSERGKGGKDNSIHQENRCITIQKKKKIKDVQQESQSTILIYNFIFIFFEW